MRRIICAAVRFKDGVMLVAPRHLDACMQQQFVRYYKDGNAPDVEEGEYGFLDQDGVFLNRYEALPIALAANQIIEKTAPLDRLFSEDMY